MRTKRYFLLLFAIPIYLFYLLFLFVFFDRTIIWGNALSFLVFVLAAIVILSIKSTTKKHIYFFVVHILWILPFFLKWYEFENTFIQILVYLYYRIPVYLILSILSRLDDEEKEFKVKRTELISTLRFVFYAFLVVSTLFLIICFFTNTLKVHIVLNDIVFYQVFVFLVLLFLLNRIQKYKEKSVFFICSQLVRMMAFAAIFFLSVYIIWSNQCYNNAVDIVFPFALCFSVIHQKFTLQKNTT